MTAQAVIGASVLAASGACAAAPQAVPQGNVAKAISEHLRQTTAQDVTASVSKALKSLPQDKLQGLKAQPAKATAIEGFKCALKLMAREEESAT